MTEPPVTPEGGELHEHSMWECGRMKHIGSVHWLDESCSLPEDALDRCQFAPYRHTRLDLKPEAREFFGDVFMELTTTPGAALPTQASDSPENREPVDLTCLGSPYPHDSADLKASCPECHP